MLTSLTGGHTVEFRRTRRGHHAPLLGRMARNGRSTRKAGSGSPRYCRVHPPDRHWGAARRVARILKAKGPSGVLAEISLARGQLGEAQSTSTNFEDRPARHADRFGRCCCRPAREIDSDFELASLLIDSADKLLVDDATRQAYFEAARTIHSDFEMHRVFST